MVMLKRLKRQQQFLMMTDKGRILLHLVTERGLVDVVAPLLERQQRSGDKVQNLLNGRDHNGCTPLHYVYSDSGRLGAVTSLLENGATIDAKDKNSGHTPLHHAASSSCIHLIELFIENGVNIRVRSHEKTDDGNTPLHLAAANCNRFDFDTQSNGKHRMEVVEFLLCDRLHVYVIDNVGRMALHWAASSRIGMLVMSLLRSAHPHHHGSEPTATDHQFSFEYFAAKEKKRRFTALHEAVHRGNVDFNTAFLLQHPGIFPVDTDNDDQDANSGNIVEVCDILGRTVLHSHCAVQQPRNLDVVHTLLKHGRANVHARDHNGKNALHVAVTVAMTNTSSCHHHSVVPISREKIVALLKCGSNVVDKTTTIVSRLGGDGGLTTLQIDVLAKAEKKKEKKTKENVRCSSFNESWSS
jgi:ankyrin repeat protein